MTASEPGPDNSTQQRRASIIWGPSEPPLLEWTFNDLLNERCRTHPNNIALSCPQQSLEYTYRQLQERARQVACALHTLGVRRGDRVGILLGNRAEYIEVSQRPTPSLCSYRTKAQTRLLLHSEMCIDGAITDRPCPHLI
jgi:non-ribosomal peptide synthetase component F